MNFSKRLVEERKRLKIKQKDIAAQLGIHINSQLDYEKGRVPAFAAYLEKIAEMGVDVQYVLTGQRNGELVLSLEEKAMLTAYRLAGQEARAKALAVLANAHSEGAQATKVVHMENSLNHATIKGDINL